MWALYERATDPDISLHINVLAPRWSHNWASP